MQRGAVQYRTKVVLEIVVAVQLADKKCVSATCLASIISIPVLLLFPKFAVFFSVFKICKEPL